MEAKRRFLRHSQGIPLSYGPPPAAYRCPTILVSINAAGPSIERSTPAFRRQVHHPYPVDADEKNAIQLGAVADIHLFKGESAHPAPPPAPATLNCRRRSVYHTTTTRSAVCWIISRTTAEPMKPAPRGPEWFSPPHSFGVDDKRLGDAIAANGFKFIVIDQHHQHIGAGQRRLKGRQRTQSIEFLRQRVDVGLQPPGSCRCASGQSARQFPSPDFRAGRQYSV